MKQFKIFLLSLASSIGAMAADIDVTPGKLESLLQGNKDQTEINLRGSIDARDLAALENLSSSVKKLDMSATRIESLLTPTSQVFGKTLFLEGEIPAYTFFKVKVNSLVLPSNVSAIGEGAFAGSDISEIVIPEGVTSLGDYAFYGCPNLAKVSLPASLQAIGKGAFGNCTALISLDLSNTAVQAVPEKAFAGAVALSDLKLPASLKSVGREAFSHTALTQLSLSNVDSFDAYALSGMPFLESLAINPDAEIGDGLLMDDISLASLSGMPELLPDYFAANCGALETSVAAGSSSLGRYSLANTLAPATLVLGQYLTEVARGAFSGLGSISMIDATALEDRIPSADVLAFEGINPPEIILMVGSEVIDLWKNDPVWSQFNVMSSDPNSIGSFTAAPDDGISIRLEGGLVIVEAGSPVSDVRIFTADGRVVFVASSAEPRLEIEASQLPSGVVIVAAADSEGNSRSVSLLLK